MQSKPAAEPSATRIDITNPKAGYESPTSAAHFATECSTSTNAHVCTFDDLTKSVDAFVHYIKPEDGDEDSSEVVALGKRVLSRFSPLGESRAFLVVGYVAEDTAIIVARRNFPEQHLRYHRAEHGAVASPQTSAVAQSSSTRSFRAPLVPAAPMLAPCAPAGWTVMLRSKTSSSCCIGVYPDFRC
jgi:hypothetical protein